MKQDRNSFENNKFAVCLLIVILFIMLVAGLFGQNTNSKPRVDEIQHEVITKHLQENYNIKITKWLLLTGFFTKDFAHSNNENQNRTYTVGHIEF